LRLLSQIREHLACTFDITRRIRGCGAFRKPSAATSTQAERSLRAATGPSSTTVSCEPSHRFVQADELPGRADMRLELIRRSDRSCIPAPCPVQPGLLLTPPERAGAGTAYHSPMTTSTVESSPSTKLAVPDNGSVNSQ
jgi:hypothetical protein